MGKRYYHEYSVESAVSQEKALAAASLNFLKRGESEKALQLIERSQSFLDQHIINLGRILVKNPELKRRVCEIADKVLQRSDASSIQHVLGSLHSLRKNPEVTETLIRMVEERVRSLDPTWDGSVSFPTLMQGPEYREALLRLPVSEITKQQDCLLLANSTPNDQSLKYWERFFELGGDRQDPRYLRSTIGRILSGTDPDHRPLVAHIQALASQLPPGEMSFWFRRNITSMSSWKKKRRGIIIRKFLGEFLKHVQDVTQADWIAISEQAVQLQDSDLQKICYDYLSKVKKDKSLQTLFLALALRLGKLDTEHTPKSMKNPIYDDIADRRPINMAALLALRGWAKYPKQDSDE